MLRLMGWIFGVSALGYGLDGFFHPNGWRDIRILFVDFLIYAGLCGLGALAWNAKGRSIKLPGWLELVFRPVGVLAVYGGTGALFLAWFALPLAAGALVGEVAGRLLHRL